MVKFYQSISSDQQEWILSQSMFFTASAPLVGKHVNLSPKGHLQSTFAVLSPNQVAYLDATGSGAETISHIYENGRVTLMFNSFGASPKILRLFCTGRVIERDDIRFEEWFKSMVSAGMDMDKSVLSRSGRSSDDDSSPGKMSLKGIRAIIVLDVWKVQTSCGFGVPVFPTSWAPLAKEEEEAVGILKVDFQADASGKPWNDRPTMAQWAGKMAEKDGALEKWKVQYNAYSLDSCPSLKSARREKGRSLVIDNVLARMRRMIVGQWDTFCLAIFLTLCFFGIALYGGLVTINVARLRVS